MNNTTQSLNHNRITLDKAINTIKTDSEWLDKLSRIFVKNIGNKHSMKVLEIIDVQSVRIIMVEDDNNTLYAISLINNHMVNNGNHNLTLTDIGRITKEIAYNKNAIACSTFIDLD
jgi:Holliday junction resolvasome RuvABC DNA-binding subunit